MKYRIQFNQCVAEALGTFCLVFAGTGAIIVNDISGGAITHVGIALSFGLVVMAMIYAIGDISGAHLNPAVTFGFLIAQKCSRIQTFRYWCSQFLGATAASVVLSIIFPAHSTLGTTAPSFGNSAAFFFETVLTFILMFVIINVASGSKEKGIMAGLAIGATVALDALCGGPVSGASMNPARSFGPALVSGDFTAFWIYVTAPFIGAVAAVTAWRLLSKGGAEKQIS